jgi:replicative DNA helicase
MESNVEIETEDEIRIPASRENIEDALLGIIMQDEEAAVVVAQSGLREEHFVRRRNKLLYSIMLNVRLNSGMINYDLVADECEKQTVPTGQSVIDFIGGLSELTKIAQATPPSTDLKTTENYIRLVFEQWRISKLKETGRWFTNLRDFNESQIVDKVATLQNILSEETLQKHGLVSIDSLIANAYARFIDRKEHPDKFVGIDTGFYWINRYRAVAKKRTTVVGARTSVGKSILVSNMITKMIRVGNHVLIFSPELDKEEYTDRIICGAANVSIDEWKAARITEADLKKISNFQQEIIARAGNNLYIEDRGVQTGSFILGSIKRHMLNHPVDVVVVDYLQKLKYYGETKKAITDIIGNFFSFAKDNNIALIVVSQLKRADKPEPELNDLKESGDIENFSDCVILLHRSSITKVRERNQGWYSIAKNRQGSTTDKVELEFDEQSLRFREISLPEEDEIRSLIGDEEEHITEQEVIEQVENYDRKVENDTT